MPNDEAKADAADVLQLHLDLDLTTAAVADYHVPDDREVLAEDDCYLEPSHSYRYPSVRHFLNFAHKVTPGWLAYNVDRSAERIAARG